MNIVNEPIRKDGDNNIDKDIKKPMNEMRNLRYNSLEKLKSDFSKNIDKKKKKVTSQTENFEKSLINQNEDIDKENRIIKNNNNNKKTKEKNYNFNLEAAKSQIEYQVYIQNKGKHL